MAEDPDWYASNYEYQVPIFVLTHEPPQVAPKQDQYLTFTFVIDGIESAIEQARAAAGDKAVQVVGGVRSIQQLLREGLVDELRADVMPCCLARACDCSTTRVSTTSGSRRSPCRRSASEPASGSAS